MTNKKFEEALTIIGNSSGFEENSDLIRDRLLRKRRRNTLFATIALVLVIGMTGGVIARNLLLKKNGVIQNDNVPPGEVPNRVPHTFEVKRLLYSDAGDDIISFRTDASGADLIPATVLGEHENCSGVYYDVKSGQTICILHEFLSVSGIGIPENCSADIRMDIFRSELAAITIFGTADGKNTGIWLFDRSAGRAEQIRLPEECVSYNELSIYNDCLCNGKLCISVNSQTNHFVVIYDVETGMITKVAVTDGEFIEGRFLSDNIIQISDGGNHFYNLATKKRVNVIGEYNYYFGGKVYSVKNWGWASRNEISVAAYDAETGTKLYNEPVLVQTVLDNGAPAFITKNTSTGEEKVVIDNYSGNCYTWSRDHAYFYAYSAENRRLACYSAKDGTWFLTQVPGISVEPVEKDGKKFYVYAEYAITVSDDHNKVLLYYTRTLEEAEPIPDHSDEKVDSVYWNEYCEIKDLNFKDSSFFIFSLEEDIKNAEGGIVYGSDSDNMQTLRDIIIDCLENRGERIDKQLTVENKYSAKLHLTAGTLFAYICEEEGVFYLSMNYNKPWPDKSGNEVYEIPENIVERILDRLTTL